MNLRYWSNENNLIDLEEVIAIQVSKHSNATYTTVVFKNKQGVTVEGSGVLEQFKEYKVNVKMLVPTGVEVL